MNSRLRQLRQLTDRLVGGLTYLIVRPHGESAVAGGRGTNGVEDVGTMADCFVFTSR